MALLIAGLPGCQKKAPGPPPRYAVLRFENLTGDPSLEWVGRAASEVLSRSLDGALDGPVLPSSALGRLSSSLGSRPAVAPGISTQRAEAIVAGATRVITGYVEGTAGHLRIAASEEDATGGKSIRFLAATDGTPMGALTLLAREFSPNARPYLTSNQEALRLYVTGFESSDSSGTGDLERALQADPRFGPAWTLLVGATVAAGKRDEAIGLIAKAREQKLDPLDAANLAFEDANLRDDGKARLDALRRICALSPGDTALRRTTAEAEATAGEFAAAAADWNQLATDSPHDADAWNQLGYARAWSGDYAGALAALKEYARIRPQDANALDSTGDVQYMFGKFAEAAASYVQAGAKDPGFQNGGELYKAAWAKFHAGDKTGADAAFAQFRAAREKAGGGGLSVFEGDWRYRTGHEKEAMALLRNDTSPAKSQALTQLAVWELIAGDRAAAAKDIVAAGPPTATGMLIARFATLPSAPAAEWESRAEHMMPGPSAAGVRRLALGYALLLDGKKQAALPVWQQIVAANSATDFFSRAIYARLHGEKPKVEPVPDPTGVNEFAAVLDRI